MSHVWASPVSQTRFKSLKEGVERAFSISRIQMIIAIIIGKEPKGSSLDRQEETFGESFLY